MNNHYTPRMIIKQFARENKVNLYHLKTGQREACKIKRVFSETDLYDPELETAFASKLEGPFGDLLHHKLLKGNTIEIDRKENFLIRKFYLINSMRNPIVNNSWDEMIKKMELENHPSIKLGEALGRFYPEIQQFFQESFGSGEKYISSLKQVMESDSLEDLVTEIDYEDLKGDLSHLDQVSLAARASIVTTTVIWDCEESGQELILPGVQGAQEMDQISIMYKAMVLRQRRKELEKEWIPEEIEMELKRLEAGSLQFMENYGIYPISPTRCICYISPYFRAFFPFRVPFGRKKQYPPLLDRKQFDRHFYIPFRMELFKPCDTRDNQHYRFEVKHLTADEVCRLNASMLNIEPEEFVFRDYNRIRESLYYYDKKAIFQGGKKHSFS